MKTLLARTGILAAAHFIFLTAAFATIAEASPVTFSLVSSAYGQTGSGMFWGFAVDQTTGNFYAHASYGSGNGIGTPTLFEYTSLAAFLANSPTSSTTLQDSGEWGTYMAANGGEVYGRTNTTAMQGSFPAGTDVAKWNGATGHADATLSSIPNMGGVNGPDTFNWGGFSGVNWMADGTGTYVLGANGPTSWQLDQVDSNLNILGTRTFTLPSQPGYGFMIDGVLLLGMSFDSNSVNEAFDYATGTLSSVAFTLTGLGSGLYLSDFAYDSLTDTLFAYNTQNGDLYAAADASAQFGLVSTPEPASLVLIGTGLAAFLRRGLRRSLLRRTAVSIGH